MNVIERMKTEIAVLKEIASTVAQERDMRGFLEKTLVILEQRMGLLRGTFTLLEGDELRIAASTRQLNSEERALGRYRVGEGVTGLVAKTGRAEIVLDVRKNRRFLNRTKARPTSEALSFVCVPLIHRGRVIGTLSVDRPMTGETGELRRDVELLEIVVNLVAEAAVACRAENAAKASLRAENRVLREMVYDNPGRLIGDCPEMRLVYEQIRQVAASDATVLVCGESGTGKELVAQAIQNLSARKDKPFVVLNCAALPEALVESELFGHEKGAFTDARERRIGRAEVANGGTLFLDEIGDLSVPVQVKLLRFLQERTFSRVGSNEVLTSDVRFVAATSRNLVELMAKRLFREDLYYRLSVFPITMPRLADRGDDIILLARYFLSKFSAKYEKKVADFSLPALNALMTYDWPGNVRELENCVERAVLTTKDGLVHTYNLPETLHPAKPEVHPQAESPGLTIDEQLAAFEKRLLQDVLRRHGNRASAAARELGLSSRAMCYRMSRAGLSVREDRTASASLREAREIR